MRICEILVAAGFIVILLGCQSQRELSIFGSYQSAGKDYQYVLQLNSDSTFSYQKYVQDGRPSCTGSFERKPGELYLLTCDTSEDISTMVSNSYMNERELTLKVRGRNRVLVNGNIFKKYDPSTQR